MTIRRLPCGFFLTHVLERFRTLSNSYYRGAHGVILVYDISNRDSFLAMDLWFQEAETNARPGVITYLVRLYHRGNPNQGTKLTVAQGWKQAG